MKINEDKLFPASSQPPAPEPPMTADLTSEEVVAELNYWQREADKESNGGESAYEREHIARMLKIHKLTLRSLEALPSAIQPIPQAALDFDDFLNNPPRYEEKMMVREYRHEAYQRWQKAFDALRTTPTHRAAESQG